MKITIKNTFLLLLNIIYANVIFSQNYDVSITTQTKPYTRDESAIFRGYSTCQSVNTGKTIAVSSIDGIPGPLKIRFFEIDSTGYVTNKKVNDITSIPYTNSLVVMDIKKLNSNNGYILCGYKFENSNPSILKPLAAILDISGNITNCHIFNDTALFSRVTESSEGELIFLGSKGKSTFINGGSKTAIIVKTYSTLIQKHYFTIPGNGAPSSFDILNDLILKSNDSLIITGTISKNCSITGNKIQTLLLCMNPETGSILWQNNFIDENYVSPKIALFKDSLFLITNSGKPNDPLFCCFSAQNGNLLYGKKISFNSFYNCENANINLDTPLIENILIQKNNILLSGKIIRGRNVFPFDCEFNKLNFNINFANAYFNNNTVANIDCMNYSTYKINSGCLLNYFILPIFSSNSTTINSHKKYYSVATTSYKDNSKSGPSLLYFPWCYSNNYLSITGKTTISVNFGNLPNFTTTLVNISTPSIRQWATFDLNNNQIGINQLGCDGFGNPCNCDH